MVYHPASWGQVPSLAGWRPLTLPGAHTGSIASPPPASGPLSPRSQSQLSRPSVCPWFLGSCLDGFRTPLPRSPGCSGLVPPTCSLLVTSRAGGTMGWGCHSNQTGRHNPGMCAAPPPCRRAAGAAAATLGRLRDSRCGARWAERPGLGGCEQKRPRA